MSVLANTQRLLQEAVLGGDPGPAVSLVADLDGARARERVAIYRHHFLESLAGVLGGVYPVVRRLVGEGYFRMLAEAHIDAHPPRDPRLSEYGGDFAATIAAEQSTALPYLADVALLEWTLHQAAIAPMSVPLDLGRAAAALDRAPAVAHVEFVESFRLLRSDWPVDEIWRAHQHARFPEQLRLESRGSFLQVGRDEDETYLRSLSAGEYFLRDRLLAHATVANAAEAALLAEPKIDLSRAFQALLTDGIIAEVRLSS